MFPLVRLRGLDMSGLPEDIIKGFAPRNFAIQKQNFERFTQMLSNGEGSASRCSIFLSEPMIVFALRAWYLDHDLEKFRQWAYAAAKAEWMYFEFDHGWPAFKPLWFLLSNHPRMIARFVNFSPPPYLEREGNTTKHSEYWFLTTALLLRNASGDWPRVIERCDHILANPPRQAWLKYQIDYEIMRAIARRDKAEVERTLSILCSPKMQRTRNHEMPFGLTEHFIGTQAVVYAKMAWYHGLEVQVDTPSIPAEWLPMTPAASYPEPHEYFARFDIEAPLQWKGG
jgi:hypothetical protein